MRVVLALAASAVLLFATAPGAHAMQLGGTAEASTHDDAARSFITEPTRFVNGEFGRFYYVAVTFPNGDFFQTGYVDSANIYHDLCQTGFATFTTALSGGAYLTSSAYNETHCNLTGGHWFKLAISARFSDHVEWHAYLDGNPIGPPISEPTADNYFINENAGISSEIANNCDIGPCTLDNTTPYPTEEYSPAIQTMADGSTDFTNPAHARYTSEGPYYNCHWFSIWVVDTNDIETGRPEFLPNTPCMYTNGSALW